MNRSALLLFPFFLLLFSSSPVSQKKKKTKSKIVKKKPSIKKSKKKRGKVPSSWQPSLATPQGKTKQSPTTPSPSYTPQSPILKIPLDTSHPTTPGPIAASTVIPLGTTDVQKTGVAVQKDTLVVIRKIEPLIKQNSINTNISTELESIKKIITENKPLPKSSLISFAPEKQKITGISKEAYTELYRGLLDYYKNIPVPTNTPPQSLSNPAPISSPIVLPSTPPIPNISSTIVSPEPLIPQIPLEEKHSSLINTTYETISTQPSTLPTPLVKKESLVINTTSQTITREPTRPPTSLKKQESPIVTHPHAQTKTLSKENEIAVKKENKKLKKNPHKKESHSLQETSKEKKKQDDELAILENKKRGQKNELEILIQDKLELISFLNQNIDKMNSTEQELKIATARYKEMVKEEKKATESSQKTNLTSFLKKDKNRQKQIEEIQKKLKTQEIIITDLQETHKTIKTSREVLQNNIDQKENEIREQLSRLSLTEETIKHLKKV